jgi:hypothetical protein
MPYRLFIDFDLLEVLRKSSKSQRLRLEAHLRQIQEYPGNHSDYSFVDASGRYMNVSFCQDHAIYFWVDLADSHIKILRIAKRELKKDL